MNLLHFVNQTEVNTKKQHKHVWFYCLRNTYIDNLDNYLTVVSFSSFLSVKFEVDFSGY